MKQQIGTMKSSTDTIEDLDVLFVALYNLLYEKIQAEPKKGIVISKGNPNQRKVTWKEVMSIAHEAEDYFALRRARTGCDICEHCSSFQSVSEVSTHIGKCKLRELSLIHGWGSCKKYSERSSL